MKVVVKFLLAAFCLFVFTPGIASAVVTFNTDGNSVLTSIDGLTVDGNTYSVLLVDDSAQNIFGTDYDFTFDSAEEAQAASEALCKSVLFWYDTPLYSSIYGIERAENDNALLLLTAYDYSSADNDITASVAKLVYATDAEDTNQRKTTAITYSATASSANAHKRVYAVWTLTSQGSPVPVPGSFLILGSGLIGLIGLGRRNNTPKA